MFCTKCGTRLNDSAQFCPNCGTKVGKKDDAESMSIGMQNTAYQQSTFKEPQYVGKNNLNSSIHQGVENKIAIAIIAIVIAVVIYFALFVDGGPIYNLETASSIDMETYLPIDKEDTFTTSTSEIFITFGLKDYEIGTIIQADWYYLDDEEEEDGLYIDSSLVTVEYDDQQVYISLTRPTNGWRVGDYEVVFFAGEDYVTYIDFSVE